MSKEIFNNDSIIFTTGAFLRPVMIKDSGGKEIWLWVVSEFIDSSFLNGYEFNPKENANTKSDLLINTTANL